MRTTAATRQDLARADLASAPQSLTWLVYCRENKLLTASEWALAAILVTLGQGQNITLSVVGMADITRMTRKTVAKVIDSLIAKGLLVFVRPGRNQTSVYRLTLPRCVNETHPGESMATTQVSKSDTPGESMATTTSREQEQEDQQNINMRSAQDDDVVVTPSGEKRAKATARSTSTRAKDDHPAIEEYISDLEDVVDELEHRLGMAPGTVNIKALAKTYRNLMIKLDQQAGVSAAVETFPADHPMWARCATKDHPVGYFLDEIERWLAS